jgi:hypothetical protein
MLEWVSNKSSGLQLRGQVRDMVEVQTKKSKQLLVLQNSERPLLFNLRTTTVTKK